MLRDTATVLQPVSGADELRVVVTSVFDVVVVADVVDVTGKHTD